jgi:hypothetical protein
MKLDRMANPLLTRRDTYGSGQQLRNVSVMLVEEMGDSLLFITGSIGGLY